MQEEITLCEQINDSEVEKTIIFCDVESITQSEFEAVGLLFGKLNAAVSIRLKRVFQST